MSLDTENVIKKFEAVCADPYGTARAAAAGGAKVAGHMCTYTPEELLHAAGYLPVRILGWSDTTQRADGLLQAYACSLARAALELALSGQLDFLNLMVFSHTCDTIQNLTDIWQRNVSGMNHLVLATPVNVRGEDSIAFYKRELERARGCLETFGSRFDDAVIEDSMRLYARHREAMRRLYALRQANPERLSVRQMLSVVLSSFLVRKEDHLAWLGDLIATIEKMPDAPATKRPRILVVGSVCQTGDYLGTIEDAGCFVADDDLCTGSRAFATVADAGTNPLDALARRYLARKPCPAKHAPGHDIGASLRTAVQQAQADGVVFLFTKFCDPWAFDYPYIHDTLEEAGVPSLLVEIEQHVPASEQYKTRVEAFAEMLGAVKG